MNPQFQKWLNPEIPIYISIQIQKSKHVDIENSLSLEVQTIRNLQTQAQISEILAPKSPTNSEMKQFRFTIISKSNNHEIRNWRNLKIHDAKVRNPNIWKSELQKSGNPEIPAQKSKHPELTHDPSINYPEIPTPEMSRSKNNTSRLLFDPDIQTSDNLHMSDIQSKQTKTTASDFPKS